MTLAEQFLSLYQNPGTRAAKRSKLRSLFAETGVTHPAALTEQHLLSGRLDLLAEGRSGLRCCDDDSAESLDVSAETFA